MDVNGDYGDGLTSMSCKAACRDNAVADGLPQYLSHALRDRLRPPSRAGVARCRPARRCIVRPAIQWLFAAADCGAVAV